MAILPYMTEQERRALLEFEAPAKLLGKFHLWKPCMAQNPARPDEAWVQSRCGRMERASIVKIFGIGARGDVKCVACFGPPVQPKEKTMATKIGGAGNLAEDDLPGMLAVQKATAEKQWPHTDDAQEWARRWAEQFGTNPAMAADEGTMIAWFANALVAGKDAAAAASPSPSPGFVLLPWLARCSWKEQTCVLCALRGPDAGASAKVKSWTRFLRAAACRNADPSDRFMRPEERQTFVEIESTSQDLLNMLPVHYLAHLMHALQIIGLRHDDAQTSRVARCAYLDLCGYLHLKPEPDGEMEIRLSDRVQLATSNLEHASLGNEVTPDGIVHRCSCGWVSRPCFSNMVASNLGADHREAVTRNPTLVDKHMTP